MRKSKLVAVAAAMVALLPLSACGGDPTSGGGTGDSSASTLTIGSANFPENELLAEMYAQAVEAKGVKVQRKFNIGARELYLKALEDGSIDMIPEYNGALLAALTQGGTVPQDVNTSEEVYDALKEALPDGLELLEQSSAEDKDTLTVTAATAKKYDLKTIEDLAPVADQLTVAAGPEFKGRYQGLVGLKEVYGVTFKGYKALDPGGPLTKAALQKGDAQVANIFSTDSVIETDNLVVLEDTKNLFLAENIVPVVDSSKVTDDITTALNEVSAALTTESLTKYLAEVAVDKKDSAVVAKEFLDANDIG
ncbi:MAG: ABC transporter substrate-binding protein [Nocardioidaceae bacterium]